MVNLCTLARTELPPHQSSGIPFWALAVAAVAAVG